MNKIKWELTEQMQRNVMTSEDKRWHWTKEEQLGVEPRMFLSNYDLLLSPSGTGKDVRECFENFIESCNQAIERIRKAQQEAREYISETDGASGKKRLNDNAEFVAEMREALKRNNGYCPCSTLPTEDTKCICKDFRDKLEDPDFDGWCNCGLYRKVK